MQPLTDSFEAIDGAWEDYLAVVESEGFELTDVCVCVCVDAPACASWERVEVDTCRVWNLSGNPSGEWPGGLDNGTLSVHPSVDVHVVWKWQKAFREGYLKQFYETVSRHSETSDEETTKHANVSALVQGLTVRFPLHFSKSNVDARFYELVAQAKITASSLFFRISYEDAQYQARLLQTVLACVFMMKHGSQPCASHWLLLWQELYAAVEKHAARVEELTQALSGTNKTGDGFADQKPVATFRMMLSALLLVTSAPPNFGGQPLETSLRGAPVRVCLPLSLTTCPYIFHGLPWGSAVYLCPSLVAQACYSSTTSSGWRSSAVPPEAALARLLATTPTPTPTIWRRAWRTWRQQAPPPSRSYSWCWARAGLTALRRCWARAGLTALRR
eukprot:1182881-Prorocentrum_minimum.AAC.1